MKREKSGDSHRTIGKITASRLCMGFGYIPNYCAQVLRRILLALTRGCNPLLQDRNLGCTLGFLLLLTFNFGCVKAPNFGPESTCSQETFRGIFVLNEGPFQQNASTLDFYAVGDSLSRIENLFECVNKKKLGDTGNSHFLQKDTLFLVINGSRLLYKIQLPTMKLLAQMPIPNRTGIPSEGPREMAIISAHKAYLTHFHAAKLWVFDPIKMQITDSISVENSMESIVLSQGKAFVSCGSHPQAPSNSVNQKMAVIETASNQLLRYIDLPYKNPGKLLVWNDKVLLVCRGDFRPNSKSALLVIDSESLQIEKIYEFEAALFDAEVTDNQAFVIRDSSIASIDLLTHTISKNLILLKKYSFNRSLFFYSIFFAKNKSLLYFTLAGLGEGKLIALDPFLNQVYEQEAGVFPGVVFGY